MIRFYFLKATEINNNKNLSKIIKKKLKKGLTFKVTVNIKRRKNKCLKKKLKF
jgi:hypothetical protein